MVENSLNNHIGEKKSSSILTTSLNQALKCRRGRGGGGVVVAEVKCEGEGCSFGRSFK